MPSWLLTRLQKRRISAFVAELPNAMDVIVRGLRSGIPLGDCLRMISYEAKEPLRSEFRIAMEAQALGLSMSDAILRMCERVPVTEVNFFAVVVRHQQKSGGNLSEALGNLSRVLRERKKMSGKIQAMSMEAKGLGRHHRCAAVLRRLRDLSVEPRIYRAALDHLDRQDRAGGGPDLDGARQSSS